MLELLEARLDIIGMHGNVLIMEGDLQVLCVDKDVDHDYTKCELESADLFCGCHEVDRDGVHNGLFGYVENEFVHFSFLNKVVFWCEE